MRDVKFLRVEKESERKMKEWMRSICFFYVVRGLRGSHWLGFKGLPIGVDCDDELMIEVVMVCAVLVLEGGKSAIFFQELLVK